jgi:hypothetical protein
MYGAITSAQRIRITARIITLRNNTVSHSNPFGEYSAASTKNSIEWKTGSRAAPRFVRLRFVVRRMAWTQRRFRGNAHRMRGVISE